MGNVKIEEKVKEILNSCEITKAPIPVVEIAKKYGFIVVEKIMEDDESGFMILSKEGIEISGEKVKKIIAINTTETPYRKRFTIAHELGHYFLEYEGNENNLVQDIIVHREENRTEIEKEKAADKFAGELLMPTDMLEMELSKLLNIELFFSDVSEYISKKFGVSYTAAKVRYDIFSRRHNVSKK